MQNSNLTLEQPNFFEGVYILPTSFIHLCLEDVVVVVTLWA